MLSMGAAKRWPTTFTPSPTLESLISVGYCDQYRNMAAFGPIPRRINRGDLCWTETIAARGNSVGWFR